MRGGSGGVGGSLGGGGRGGGRDRGGGLGYDSSPSIDRPRMYHPGGGGGRGRSGGGGDDDRYPRHRETTRRGGSRGGREGSGSGRGNHSHEEHPYTHHEGPDEVNPGKIDHDEGEDDPEDDGVDQVTHLSHGHKYITFFDINMHPFSIIHVLSLTFSFHIESCWLIGGRRRRCL